MNDQPSPWEDKLRTLLEAREKSPAWHPSKEQLARYFVDETDDSETSQIDDHLPQCQLCRQALEALEVPLGFEVELNPKPVPGSEFMTRKPEPSARRYYWPVVLSGLAAGLLIGFLGHGLLNQSPAPPIPANGRILSLVPTGQTMRSHQPGQMAPTGKGPLVLLLNASGQVEAGRFSAILSREGDEWTLEIPDLEPGPGGLFSPVIPPGLLKPGTYRLTLRDESNQEISSYAFQIPSPPGDAR